MRLHRPNAIADDRDVHVIAERIRPAVPEVAGVDDLRVRMRLSVPREMRIHLADTSIHDVDDLESVQRLIQDVA